jgi:hypothetical protein
MIDSYSDEEILLRIVTSFRRRKGNRQRRRVVMRQGLRVQTSIKKIVSVHKTLGPAEKESKGGIGSDLETELESEELKVGLKSTSLTSS